MEKISQASVRDQVTSILKDCNVPQPDKVVGILERGLRDQSLARYSATLTRRADQFLTRLVNNEEKATGTLQDDHSVHAVEPLAPPRASVDALLAELYPEK